jgi:hypothetical protein
LHWNWHATGAVNQQKAKDRRKQEGQEIRAGKVLKD